MNKPFLPLILALSMFACNGNKDETDPPTEADTDTDTDADTDADTDTDTDADADTDTDTDADTDTDTDPPADAEVRVIHLSPDAPNVDVFVDDQLSGITDLAFGDGTPYVALPATTTNFKVSATGTAAADAVLDFDLDLMPGVKYSAVAYDTLANIAALPLTDDDTGIDPGDTRFQIAHVAAGIGTVDIWDVNTDTPVLQGVAFGASAVVDLPAGEYELGLDTDLDGTVDAVFVVPDLGGGILVDVFAVTDAAGTPFLHAQFEDGSEAAIDVAPNANVRVLHLSPSAPNVDVFVDDALSGITDLPFGDGTDYVELTPGLTNFKVTATGDVVGNAVLDFDLDLNPGMFYTATAYGELANIAALPLVDDPANIPAGNTRITVAHTADGVGQVDILNLTDGGFITEDLDYGATATLDVPDAARTLGLDIDDDGQSDFLFDVPALGPDTWVNVYAVLGANGPELVAQFENGDTVSVAATVPARVRVLHASPDAPNVDVFVDDAPSGIADLAFTFGTPYISFIPDTYNFKVSPVGTTTADAVIDVDLDLAADTNYSAVAYGAVANIAALPLVDDAVGIPAGNTRIQVAHVADGVGQVDIWNMDATPPAPLIENLDYEAVQTLDYTAGAITLGLDTDDDGTPNFTFDVPDLGADAQVNVFAVLDTAGPILLAHFADGTTAVVPAN
jgi:hypothetical protein